MSGRQRYQWLLLLLVAGALLWWVLADGGQEPESTRTTDPSAQSSASPPDSPTHELTETTTPTIDPTVAAPGGIDPHSGLPFVELADLPPEAAQTVDLIEQGGPFPEEEDGGTFRNDEEILPEEPRGYYREYTVPTPGSDDRGARRIVAGEGGELYWTDDHYRSFSRIEVGE